MVVVAWLVLTYLVAAVPFGLVITTLLGASDDVRDAGSGNIGATNVARVAGWRVAAAVLLLDAAKGFVPTALAPWFWPFDAGVEIWCGVVAIVAFVGHCWSIYLELKGGKGVATATGALSALVPGPIGIAVAVWGLVFAVGRRASVAALVAAPVLVIATVVLDPGRAWVVGVIAVGVAVRHLSNVRRLVRGEEDPVRVASPRVAGDLLSEGPAGGPAGAAWRE